MTAQILRTSMLIMFFGVMNACSSTPFATRVNADPPKLAWQSDAQQPLTRFGSQVLRMSDPVKTIEWSRDGKRIVATDQSGSVRSWAIDNGKLECMLRKFGTKSVAVFPDGERVIAASDIWLTVYNVRSGKSHHIVEHSGGRGFEVVALINDGKEAIANLGREDLGIWEVQTGKRLNTLVGYRIIQFIVPSPDSKRIAVSSYSKTLYLIDVASGKELWKTDVLDDAIDELVFACDGKQLATIEKGVVRLRDPATGKVLHTLEHAFPNEGGYDAVVFCPDNKTMVTGDFQGTIRIWNRATLKETRSFNGVTGCNEKIAISPDGSLLATGGNHETIYIYDIKTGKLALHAKDVHTAAIRDVRFSSDGKKIISASNDQTIRIWDKKNANQIVCLIGHPWNVTSLAVFPDGKTIASASNFDEGPRLWDIENGRMIMTIANEVRSGHNLVLSPDGQRLVYLVNSNLHVWDTRIHKELISPTRVSYRVGGNCTLFLPDGKTIVVKGPNEITFLDSSNGNELRRANLRTSTFDIGSIGISDDCRLIGLSTHAALEMKEMETMHVIWKYGDNKNPKSLPFLNSTVTIVVILKDARLVTGHADGTIRIWNPRADPAPIQLEGHTGAITSFAISPDGTELLSGSTDTTAMLWKIPPLPKSDTKLTEEQTKQIWADLRDTDAAKAHKSLWKGTEDAKPTLAMLERNVQLPTAPEAGAVRMLIADLSSNRFAVRQQAFGKLAAFDTLVVPVLKERLKAKPEQDEREQIEKLLKAAETWTGDRLRELRAVQCVEMIATPDAKKLLDKWSQGPAEARLTKEAKLAGERLDKLLKLRKE